MKLLGRIPIRAGERTLVDHYKLLCVCESSCSELIEVEAARARLPYLISEFDCRYSMSAARCCFSNGPTDDRRKKADSDWRVVSSMRVLATRWFPCGRLPMNQPRNS